ncbi:MAG: citrate (Si)-synthase [Flavobacteriaceae bacterium]|nr:MAG: citrate (Si)-synthase [Flavobacteriaceae bacterium]
MSDSVKISYKEKEFTYPVIEGTMGDIAVDISTLRSDTGLITLDEGFKNTGSTESSVTFLDGDKGQLLYRGYSIDELAENATFTEVMYLLLYGELPTASQLDSFNKELQENCTVNQGVKDMVNAFPTTAHPMSMVGAISFTLSSFYPEVGEVKTPEEFDKAAMILLAKFPALCAMAYRRTNSLPINLADPSLDYVSNFYQLMFKNDQNIEISPSIVSALNKLLILHADHEQNCSAATVRVVGSSQAGLSASIAAGVAALWGPLHGGANQAVIEMLEDIKKDGSGLQFWVDKAKDKTHAFRLMGFGHRVYKNFDPRAKIIKQATDEVLAQLGIKDDVLDLAKGLEEVALQDEYFVKRNLYPNVDFYSGIIYRALGIPKEMFTVMFALGRLPGWIAQWKELRIDKQAIGRPRQVYIGAKTRSYVSLDKR